MSNAIADQLTTEIEQPPHADDDTQARHERAGRLVAEVGHDRPALEAVKSHYLRRLHRRSDDFAATEALRTIGLALALLPPEDEQGPPRRRRWWTP